MSVSTKEKSATSTIRSAFIKAETLAQLIRIELPTELQFGIYKAQSLETLKQQTCDRPISLWRHSSRY